MADFAAGLFEGALAALAVIVGIAAIAGLVVGGRWAASWHRSRRRPQPGAPDALERLETTPAELERRRRVLRALAAGQYLEKRDKDQ